MNKEIIELIDSIKNKKQEVQNFVNENKLEDAKKSKEELIQLQNKLDILYDLDNDSKNLENSVKNKEPLQENEKITEERAFIDAIKNTALKKPVPENILNSLKTSDDEGILIPQDISTSIIELRRQKQSLESLVNVEKVTKTEGSRVIEKNSDIVGFEAIDEEAVFPDMPEPEFLKLSYKLKKFGGILKATQEFYQATFPAIKGYIVRWIAKKGITTRNNLILKAIDDKKDNSKITITGIDTLKDIINTELDPAILGGTKILTNQDGFNWLDKLKDENGKYILQPDITQKQNYLLFGKYPVIVFSNKQIVTKENKIPFYIGNLKEFVTLFDYEKLFIEMSSQAGELWEKDMIGIKVRERLDVQIIDENALVKGEVTLPTTKSRTTKRNTNKDNTDTDTDIDENINESDINENNENAIDEGK